jgi:NDP-sugar pyrophosphorylase family protein
MGTRMQALAKGLPKSLIPIKNRPFLHYQLAALAKQGVQNVLLCVGHGADQIERYAEDGRTWGLHVRYAREGNELLGTGGALRLAGDQGLLEPVFFVLYGDSYLTADFLPVWTCFKTRTEPALMVVLKNEGRWDASNARFDGQKVSCYDKMNPSPDMAYIDYGLSVLRAEAVSEAIPPRSVYDLSDLFHKFSERGRLAGFEVATRFYEIGSPEGLEDFTAYLSKSA